MRIPSGTNDQYVYFVAVDSTDFTTRETGLSSFAVYRSRNGAAAAAMTTPTINETDATNMPGVYELLLDVDMTIGSGNDSEAMVLHVTQASMAPVTLQIELYRPKITAGYTLGVESDGDLSKVNTLDGHTAQTGDSYALASGASGFAALVTDLDDIKGTGFVKDTHSLVDIEGYVDLIDDGASGLAKIAADAAAVLVDTSTTLQAELDGIQADTEDIQSRLPAALVSGRIDASVGAMAADVMTAAAVSSDFGTEIADAFLDRDMSSGTDSGSTTVRTPRQALRFSRNRWVISGGNLTVYKEDDATSSWSSSVSSSAGNPLVESDPAGP